MQTQQVHGVVGGGLLYTAKVTSAKASDNSFDQLIQMSQKAGNVEENVPTSNSTAQKENVTDNVNKAENPETDVASNKAEDSEKMNKKPEFTKSKGTEEASEQEAAERAAGLLNQVSEVVSEILDLSEEQLDDLMQQMGITEIDLLNPETLKNLVLMVNNEQDAVTLITDSELLSTVNELIQQVENVLQEAGVTSENLVAALEQPEFEAMVSEALEQVKSETETYVEDTDATEKTTTIEFRTEKDSQTDRSEVGNDNKESSMMDSFANQFVQNLQQAAEQLEDVSGQNDIVQMIREIADQILEKVRVSVTPDTTSLEMVLTPEELGKVNLTITEQDGMMKAKFVTENELAKEAIESNMVQFKEMLNEQGIKVESIEVTVSNFDFDKNGQAGESNQEEKKNGKRSFVADDSVEQISENDQIAQHFMDGGESTVNFMA